MGNKFLFSVYGIVIMFTQKGSPLFFYIRFVIKIGAGLAMLVKIWRKKQAYCCF